ncbi:hypothetical protein [Paraburkholderia sp.]|uniref:hypothetical protein n=1 Tax=Paraburkholderia sp. TaxID=1926495 RepID=UPI0023A6538C|nr:hypothetical protein [Paraburkholderia sp.]MDE1184851.1 hypothetical protein [Paraburkholderia sp.]
MPPTDFSPRRTYRTRHAEPVGARTRLVAARLNPAVNVILAFWALFHCRHARPPLPPRVYGR